MNDLFIYSDRLRPAANDRASMPTLHKHGESLRLRRLDRVRTKSRLRVGLWWRLYQRDGVRTHPPDWRFD